MSAARVWVTRDGSVRYGWAQAFDTLGRVEEIEDGWRATAVTPLGVFPTKADAVARLVARAGL